MAEIPPGLRTELHFPMGPKVKEVKAEHIVQGTVAPKFQPAPVPPPPDPPDPPDPPAEPRFYVTAYDRAVAYDSSAVFVLDGLGGWVTSETDVAVGNMPVLVLRINPATGAREEWAQAPTPDELPALGAWMDIGVSRNYVYLSGTEAVAAGGTGLIMVRRPIDGSGDWTVCAQQADFLPAVSGSYVRHGWDSGKAGLFLNAGVDRETDRIWQVVDVNEGGAHAVGVRAGHPTLHVELLAELAGGQYATFGGPAFWVQAAGYKIAILGETIVLLDMPTVGEGVPFIPAALYDLGDGGSYRLQGPATNGSPTILSFYTEEALWEPEPQVVCPLPPDGIPQPYFFVGLGPQHQQWTPATVAPFTTGFLVGQTTGQNGVDASPFATTPDAGLGVVPTYSGKKLINIDFPGYPGWPGVLPLNREEVGFAQRAVLSYLTGGSLLLRSNPQATPRTPLFVVDNADYVAADHPGRVFTIDTQYPVSNGVFGVHELNLWTGARSPWVNTPVVSETAQIRGLHITFSHIYLFLLATEDPSRQFALYRRPLNAAPGDPWELYMSMADLEALSFEWTSGMTLNGCRVLANSANGMVYAQPDWSDQNANVVIRRPPGGAWELVDRCSPDSMCYAGPGNTRVTFMLPGRTTLVIGADPEERIPAPQFFEGDEVDDGSSDRIYQLTYVAPGQYGMFTNNRRPADPQDPDIVFAWAYAGGVWGLRVYFLDPSHTQMTHLPGGTFGPVSGARCGGGGVSSPLVTTVFPTDGSPQYYTFDGIRVRTTRVPNYPGETDMGLLGYTYTLDGRLVGYRNTILG